MITMAMWSVIMSKADDTTGFNLWWLRLQEMEMGWTFKLFEKILRNKKGVVSQNGWGVEPWYYSFMY